MRVWLRPALEALSRGEAAMLVHVSELKGSGPREPGAQMLVTENAITGTIGGGELERTAMQRARELLNSGKADLKRLALGPELNQCCGGWVTLAFEPFAPADLAWLKKLMRAAEEPEPVFRTLRIDAGGRLRRDWAMGGEGPDFAARFEGVAGSESTAPTSPLRGGRNGRHPVSGGGYAVGESTPTRSSLPASRPATFDLPAGGRWGAHSAVEREREGPAVIGIRERVNPPAQALWIFGAGHVGRSLVPALHPLGFAITWTDGRAGQFPELPLPNVKQLALAMPELAVDEAPAGAIFLVMTHSHPLDEAVCEAVLRRDDFAYLGLIGSMTKRARFVKRLGAAGIPTRSLERLTCPIGLPGIRSKEPGAIAASVAADLLIRRETGLLTIAGAALHAR